MNRTLLLITAWAWAGGVTSSAHAQAPNVVPPAAIEEISKIASRFGTEWIDRAAKKKNTSAPHRWSGRDLQGRTPGRWDLIAGMKDRVLSGKAVPLPQWLPMCFLFDSAVNKQAANLKITKMAAAYAVCGIALVPFPFSLQMELPNDAAQVAKLASAACPLPEVFGVRGAVQVEAKSAALPQQMCQNYSANGCSTLCSTLSVSFVAPNSNPSVGLHESMHSNCCGPLCVDQGQGTGSPAGDNLEIAMLGLDESEHYYASTKAVGTSSISEAGCEALRAGASPNDFTHWYDPEQTTYYDPANPAFRKDLAAGDRLFPAEFIASIKSPPERITAKLLSAVSTKLPFKIDDEFPLVFESSRALRVLGGSDEYQLGFAAEAVGGPAEHKKAKARRKGWERRPASEEVRIFDGFGESNLNKTSVEHFAE